MAVIDRMQDRIRYQGAAYGAGRAGGRDRTGEDSLRAGQDFSDAFKGAQGQEPEIEEEDTRTLRQKMADMIAKLNEKVKNGETEQSFRIGAQSFTIREWDQMIERIDAAQEAFREQQRSRRGERLKEKAQKGVAELEWMDNRYAMEGVTGEDAASLTVEEMLDKLLMDTDDPEAAIRGAREKELAALQSEKEKEQAAVRDGRGEDADLTTAAGAVVPGL